MHRKLTSSWRLIDKYFELFDRPKSEEEVRGEDGLLHYWHPLWPEFTVFPPGEIRRLRAYIRSRKTFIEVLYRAAKAGFPLYFKGIGFQFTRVKKGGIIYLDQLREEPIRRSFHCRSYGQRVTPGICISRRLVWPKVLYSEEEIEEERARLEEEIDRLRKESADPREVKRAARRIRNLSRSWDPYPDCRSCTMGRRLELETCFGVNYNQLLQGCQKCPDAVECVHLMRIRCAQLLEERKEEVERASRDSNLTKKERRRMARKRKKEEEEPKKKAGRPPAEKKELSEKAKKTRIKELKGQLEEARADKDKKAAGKIRAELRSLGHYLSQTGEDSRKGRKKDDDDEPKKLRGRKEKPEEEEEEEED